MLSRIDDDALDGGPKGPATERFCVVAREATPTADMIRFVVGPDGSVVPDLKRNLPGRGLWVTATQKALETAVARKLFAKGFKRDVRTGADFVAMTGRLLERAALDALAIAGKAGEAVAGFAKVEAAIGRGGIIAILHAADASPDGARKVAAALRTRFEGENGRIPVIRAFESAQLDLALGRSNVVHAALLAGPASQGFLTRCLRMMRFRTGDKGVPGLDDALGREPKGTDSE